MSKCQKVRYRTEIDAKIALAKVVWKDHGEKRSYRCPHCRGWHLTSQPAKSRQLARAVDQMGLIYNRPSVYDPPREGDDHAIA